MTNYWWWASCLHRQELPRMKTITTRKMRKTEKQTRNRPIASIRLSTGCIQVSSIAGCKKNSASWHITIRLTISSKHWLMNTGMKLPINSYPSICFSNYCHCWIQKTFSVNIPTSTHGSGIKWNTERNKSFTRYTTTSLWTSGSKYLKSRSAMICSSATSPYATSSTSSPITWSIHPNWKKRTLTSRLRTSPEHGCWD